MAKSKNRKKKAAPPNGGYKKFINDMMNYINSNFEEKFPVFNNCEKRLIYDKRLQMRRPEAANKLVTVKELDKIHKYIKEANRKKRINLPDKKISTYESQLYASYVSGQVERVKKGLGAGHVDYLSFKEAADKSTDSFFIFCMHDVLSTITRVSTPTHKYYGIKSRVAKVIKDDPRIELVINITGIPAQKKYFNFNGSHRPAYRLGKAYEKDYFRWIQIKASELQDTINKNHATYSLYIQAHAIHRMKERLDLLDKESINITIWECTVDKTNFIVHKQYTLMEVCVFDVRIGYFVVEPVDDMLIIKTFLFITHNCTPEGDKLKELTGLGKNDISYWKIDRLSTFVNLDEEKYPQLMQLFTDAGMQDLAQLKDKDFDIESIQDANLDRLREYLNSSHQYKNAREEDVVIHA